MDRVLVGASPASRITHWPVRPTGGHLSHKEKTGVRLPHWLSTDGAEQRGVSHKDVEKVRSLPSVSGLSTGQACRHCFEINRSPSLEGIGVQVLGDPFFFSSSIVERPVVNGRVLGASPRGRATHWMGNRARLGPRC